MPLEHQQTHNHVTSKENEDQEEISNNDNHMILAGCGVFQRRRQCPMMDLALTPGSFCLLCVSHFEDPKHCIMTDSDIKHSFVL